MASILRSSIANRSPGIGLDALGIQAHPPLGDFMRDAAIDQLERHVLGRIGKQMQLDVGVLGGGAAQHRPHQARLELRQAVHGPQRRPALGLERDLVAVRVE